jgi:hypothetical protein
LVGRIPFYGSYADLDSILQKTINYETASDVAWRESALMPMAISQYVNELSRGPRVDGHELAQYETNDILAPAGWRHYSLFERRGLTPVTAPADAALSEGNLLNEWQKGYGVVTGWGHGSPWVFWEKYWDSDNGDHVAQASEIKYIPAFRSSDAALLDDTHPSLVIQIGCSNGDPRMSDNLAYSLLKHGAVATITATSTAWYALATWTPALGPQDGDSASYAYYTLKQIVADPSTTFAQALAWDREHFGFVLGNMSWMNMTTFNLYGDPSLSLASGDKPPSAVLNATAAPKDGEAGYTFTVTYSDQVGVKVSSLDNCDIRVTGPGFDQLAALVGVDDSTDGKVRTATYSIPAPGGAWALADTGTYTVSMEPNQAEDVSGSFVPAGKLGTFQYTPTSMTPLVSGRPKRFLDGDGSLVTVTLTGPGSGYFTLTNSALTGAPINSIVLAGATSSTSLAISSVGGIVPGTSFHSLTISGISGMGTAFGRLSAKGIALDANGTIDVEGGVSSLTLGNVGPDATVSISGPLASFTAGSVAENLVFRVKGGLGTFTAASVSARAEISVAGDIKSIHMTAGGLVETTLTAGLGIGTVTVNGGNLSGTIVANGAAGIAAIKIPSGGFSGTIGAPTGGIKSLTVGRGDLVGRVESDGVAGIGTISVAGGNLSAVIQATHPASAIKSVTVNGAILSGTEIEAGTGGIGLVSVKGDADLTIHTTGKLAPFSMRGSATALRTLSGLFDVKVMTSLNAAFVNADRLTVRATESIGSMNLLSMTGTLLAAGNLGNITVSKDVTDSMILSGYDIGAGLALGAGDGGAFGAGKGNIGSITVGGSMSGTSIAANVSPGDDGLFGTADDVVLAPTLQGAIKSLTVKGALTGSTNSAEHFGVAAHKTIGSVSLSGTKLPPPWPLDPAASGLNISIVQNIV